MGRDNKKRVRTPEGQRVGSFCCKERIRIRLGLDLPNPDPFLATKAPNPLPYRGSDPFLVIAPHQCYLFSSRPSLPLQGDSCLHRKRISDTIPSAKSVFSRI